MKRDMNLIREILFQLDRGGGQPMAARRRPMCLVPLR